MNNIIIIIIFLLILYLICNKNIENFYNMCTPDYLTNFDNFCTPESTIIQNNVTCLCPGIVDFLNYGNGIWYLGFNYTFDTTPTITSIVNVKTGSSVPGSLYYDKNGYILNWIPAEEDPTNNLYLFNFSYSINGISKSEGVYIIISSSDDNSYPCTNPPVCSETTMTAVPIQPKKSKK